MPYWDISFRASLEDSGNWKNLSRMNYLLALKKKKRVCLTKRPSNWSSAQI